MKKLLLTTAIAGSALLAGNAIAQTTVSGQLDLAFKAITSEKTNDAISSDRGMGKEWQINIANKGKLNNGMDYAAGFSLEHDGQQTGSNGLDENVYIDITSGATTFTIGTDHIQQSERTLATFVGLIAEDITNSNVVQLVPIYSYQTLVLTLCKLMVLVYFIPSLISLQYQHGILQAMMVFQLQVIQCL